MENKYYSLPGLVICTEADEQTEDNAVFRPFIGKEETPDISVGIFRGSLPEPEGKPIASNRRFAYYMNAGVRRYYTRYFVNEETGYVPYACFERGADKNTLYVDFSGKLWDKMVFDALCVPDLFAERGSILIHASLIEVEGEGIIFVGHKGAGKSTQAELWRKYGNARIINGDRAVINKKNGVWYAGGSPLCGSSATALNINVPLKAVVIPEKGNENSVKTLSPWLAFPQMIEQVTYTHEIADITEKAVDTVLGVLDSVPVYELTNTAEKAAVQVLEKILWK